jgi:F-type H+-transporting ATPase subunit b
VGFLSIDGTLVVQLINFAIFFAVLNVVFLRPVANAIAKRRAYINGLVSDYERYQVEAAGLRAQAEAVRFAARREAEQLVAAERARASNEAAEIATNYAQQATSIAADARKTAEAELNAARAGQDEAARKLASLVLERVLPEGAP